MDIATWNVNGVRARLPVLERWLREARPEVVCLQEIKCEEGVFPKQALEDLGYEVVLSGQKGFNGVAILSKRRMEEVHVGLLPVGKDPQARYLEAVVPFSGQTLRVCCLYLPNGNPIEGEKYTYKLRWMEALLERVEAVLGFGEPVMLLGDYNVIPEVGDAKSPERWKDDALFQWEVRKRFFSLFHLGLYDAVRLSAPTREIYTFWDYQGRAREKNEGIRIDHALLCAQAMDRFAGHRIDDHVRDWTSPSDHVPVIVQMKE